MRILLLGYAAFLAAGRGPAPALAAPMAEHFSRADVDAYVEAAVRTLGDSESTTADRDYAVRLLGVLDNPSVASGYKSSACASAAVGLKSGDLEQIHHGISLASGVGGCTGAKTSPAGEEVAAAMKERHDLVSLYHATLAAPLLGVDQDTGVLDKVLDLVKQDGSVKSYPGGLAEDGNAFMAAGLLAALVPKVEGVAETIALRTVETLKDSVLASEPSLLVQLNRAHGSKFFVKATKLKSMARGLLEASHTDSPKGMLAAYEAIKVIESYDNAPFPVNLVPSSPSVKEMLSGEVGLLVTSLLGTPANVKSAVLSKLTAADGSDALPSSASTTTGRPLGAPNTDGFRALPASSVAPGLYTAEFSVELEGGEEGKTLTAKIPMAVGTMVGLTRTRVSVSASKKAPSVSLSSLSAADMEQDEDFDDVDAVGAANYLLAPGDTLPGTAQASTLDGHHLHVRLLLSGGDAAAAPHQVFVRFTHALTGLDTFFVAAPVVTGGGSGSGEFSVSVSLGDESATFLQRSGAYELAVLVGGPLVSPPVLEELGVIDLDFPVTKGRNWPLYARPLLHETDVALGPLPEKHHTFREPEVRPHAGVSLLFTALVLVPLAALARGMKIGGADLRKLPKSASGRVWCALYQACMVSVVLLFATYWAALTMAYTLRVLAVLSLATTVTGRKALQSIALEANNGGSSSSSRPKIE